MKKFKVTKSLEIRDCYNLVIVNPDGGEFRLITGDPDKSMMDDICEFLNHREEGLYELQEFNKATPEERERVLNVSNNM